MAMYAAKIKVKGRVHDVSFRTFTKRNADILGLRGFVTNISDGSVEVHVEGDKDNIEVLIEAIRTGSEKAIVKTVDVEWRPYSGIYTDFKIIY